MNTADTELRKLPADYLSSVEEVLETNEDWKTLMNLIPKNLENLGDDQFERKYNGEDIRLIESHSNETRQKCAKVLFQEWGTSGRVRPTLRVLQTLLVKALMFKAADRISNMLGEPLPERPLDGPGAPIDINITDIINNENVTCQLNAPSTEHCNDTTRQVASVDCINISPNNNNSFREPVHASPVINESPPMMSYPIDPRYIPDSAILNPKTSENLTDFSITSSSMFTSETSPSHPPETQSTPAESKQQSNFYQQTGIQFNVKVIEFSSKDLEDITNSFSESNCIGTGGFSKVFLGTHYSLGKLAVKKLNKELSLDVQTKTFYAEVKLLSLLHHDNIVHIKGFAIDGSVPCIVFEYIEGGSLKQKIAAKGLTKKQRLNIMIGTAEGLKYVHNTVKHNINADTSASKSYLIHRDVKSANILLTKDFVPKLSDFGLAKQFEQTYMTDNAGGTKEYMAPETFTGTITQKSDVYSYGIVLLELLTGLKPLVPFQGGEMNIKDYLETYCVDGNITQFLDKDVGEWVEAQSIYCLAKHCLKQEKNERPSMDVVCSELQKNL